MFQGWNWKHWVSVSATTFIGAGVAALMATIGSGQPVSLKVIEVAALAGIAAVVHLYQEPPSKEDKGDGN